MRLFLSGALLVLAGSAFIHQTDAVPCSRNATVGPDVRELTSENYPGNYNDYDFCRWYITGPADHQLTIEFEGNFDVEAGGTAGACPHDKIHVFDTTRPGSGATVAALAVCGTLPTANGPFCGQTAPGSIVIKGNTAVVQFCSDYGVTGSGWKIKLSYIHRDNVPTPAPWANQVFNLNSFDDETIISSPNFPTNYFDDYTAEYTINNVVSTRTVVIRAIAFNLATTSTCTDTLEIVDVANSRTYSYCGNTPLSTLEIVGVTQLRIRFVTDSLDNARGFQIGFSLVACASHQFACDDNNGCYLPGQSCDGTPQCVDGSDEKWQYCAPECGKPHFPMNENNRIVGGTVVKRHSLPWQVAVLRSNRQFCGGTVISDQWILSAAHCFQPSNPAGLSVRIGGHLLGLTPEMDRAVEIEVEKVINHPYYNVPIQFDYDAALLKLKTKIPFRKNIVPACLPRQGADPAPTTRCMTSGWGDTRLPGGGAPGLRQVYVPVVNRQSCNVTYPGSITNRMICAGTVQGGFDSCQGDSGGPFICPTSDNRWTVSGIVSWGRDCALPAVPGVYANTGAMSHWIIDTIATN